jgi:hypothetical protein
MIRDCRSVAALADPQPKKRRADQQQAPHETGTLGA